MAKNKFERWCESFGLEYLRRLAENGLTDEEMAIHCALELSTFRKWKKRYPQFSAAIELGQSGSDFAVVQSLYKKATGYTVSVNKTHKLKKTEYDPETGKKLCEYEELVTIPDEDYIEPDLRAEIFWLCNRQPGRWNEKGKSAGGAEETGGVVIIPNADTLDESDGFCESPEKSTCGREPFGEESHKNGGTSPREYHEKMTCGTSSQKRHETSLGNTIK